jgi:hypothetical protein
MRVGTDIFGITTGEDESSQLVREIFELLVSMIVRYDNGIHFSEHISEF